jgi:hypothetical protein
MPKEETRGKKRENLANPANFKQRKTTLNLKEEKLLWWWWWWWW